jgi:F-type H+-transporting ATPase subunit b
MASPNEKAGHGPAAAKTTATTEHGHGAKASFPPFEPSTFASQLIWLALVFTALYVLMSRVALPRIAEVVEGRAERIARDLEAAQKLKGETDKALAAYEKAHADARAKASAIAKETRDRLQAETDKERARVDKDMNARIVDAESRIAATKTKALASVNDIAADVAGSLVSSLSGQAATADEIRNALAAVAGK